jgi:hypothetical protein
VRRWPLHLPVQSALSAAFIVKNACKITRIWGLFAISPLQGGFETFLQINSFPWRFWQGAVLVSISVTEFSIRCSNLMWTRFIFLCMGALQAMVFMCLIPNGAQTSALIFKSRFLLNEKHRNTPTVVRFRLCAFSLLLPLSLIQL